MKRPIVLVLTLALLSSVVTLAQTAKRAATPKPASSAVRAADLLFVQSAAAGTFANGTLTLTTASPVLFFMERPGRVTGTLTLAKFLSLWSEGEDSFKKDPPNAVISIVSGQALNNAVIVLERPNATATGVRYAARVLSGTIPPSFSGASLFIDAFPSSATRSAPTAPVASMGTLYQATAQALSNAAHNATTGQQQTSVTAQAATTEGVATLYSLDTASTGKATADILNSVKPK